MKHRRFLFATALSLLVATSAWSADDKSSERCLRRESRIAELQLKLRTGYSARQGRVYRQKMATLLAERRLAGDRGRCRSRGPKGPTARANPARRTPTRDLRPDWNSDRRALTFNTGAEAASGRRVYTTPSGLSPAAVCCDSLAAL